MGGQTTETIIRRINGLAQVRDALDCDAPGLDVIVELLEAERARLPELCPGSLEQRTDTGRRDECSRCQEPIEMWWPGGHRGSRQAAHMPKPSPEPRAIDVDPDLWRRGKPFGGPE